MESPLEDSIGADTLPHATSARAKRRVGRLDLTI
jgi:hypothetical protein